MVKPEGYKYIALKEDLIQRVVRVVKANIGYRSIADFIREAIRLRLEQLEPLIKEKIYDERTTLEKVKEK